MASMAQALRTAEACRRRFVWRQPVDAARRLSIQAIATASVADL
jgi:hypothetical protein